MRKVFFTKVCDSRLLAYMFLIIVIVAAVFVVEGSKNFHLLILQYRQHRALKENQQVFLLNLKEMFLSESYTKEDEGELKMLGIEYDMSFWWLCKNFSLKPTFTQFLRVTFDDNTEVKMGV